VLNRLFRFLLLRPEEVQAVVTMACYFFVAMSAASIIKALQFTFFLRNIGFDWHLPFLYVISAILAIPIVLLYRVLARRLSHLALASGTLLFFFVTLVVAGRLLQTDVTWINFPFFVWSGLFTLLIPTLGWIISYDLFTTREGKRVFGLLGLGGIAGGAAGAYWTLIWAEEFGTRGLIIQVLVQLILLQVVLLLIRPPASRQDRFSSAQTRFGIAAETRARRPNRTRLLGSPYLQSIAALVFISGLVTTIVDLHYVRFLEYAYPASDAELTEFISAVLGSMFVISGLFQLAATGRILNRFGVPVALLILPLALATGSFTAVVLPGFWAAVALKGIDGSLRPSLHRTSVEVLYVPVADAGTMTWKSFVDLVVFRTGDAAGALVFLVVSGIGPALMTPAVIGLTAVFWVFLAWRTASAYLNNLRQSVQKAAFSRRRLHLNDFRTADMVEAQLSRVHGWRLKKALDQLVGLSETEQSGPEEVLPIGEEMVGSHISDLYQRKPAWYETVNRLTADPDPETAAAAFCLLVRYQPSKYLSELKKALQPRTVPDAVYLFYVAEYVDDPRPLVTSRKVLEWAENAQGQVGAALAGIMGKTRDPSYLPVLARWLDSSDLYLQRGATEAIGHFGDVRYWYTLISFLKLPHLRNAARKGLAHYGEAAVDGLVAVLRDHRVDGLLKREIPLILGQIESSRARASLMLTLFWPDPVTSFRALKVLNKTRAYRDLSQTEASFRPVLMQWARQYYQALNLRSMIPPEPGAAWRLLKRMAVERQFWTVEKIFRTLDLFLPRGEGYLSYVAFQDGQSIIRDNAIELVDLRLKGEIRQALLPILVEKDAQQALRQGRRLFGLPSDRDGTLRDALFDEDRLLRAVALAIIREEGRVELLAAAKAARADSDAMVRETAAWTVAGLTADSDEQSG
jgi:ATP:ADP antiporter, AAA family